MSDEQIQDLKQFIHGEISQQTSELRDGMDEMRNDIGKLEVKVDDLSEAVAEALDNANDNNDQRFKKLERRVVRLEHKTA